MARGGGRSSSGIKVHPPLKTLGKMYTDVAKEFQDVRPMWNQLAPTVAAEVDTTVASIGPPLSAEYLKRKKGGSILRRTGAMLSSVGVLAKTKNAFRYGVKAIPYVRAVEAKRPFLVITQKMEAAFEMVISRFVDRSVDKAFK